MERVSLGHVAVDSGQLMIVDPCRLDEHWNKEDYDPKSKPTPFSYKDISQKNQKGVNSSNFPKSLKNSPANFQNCSISLIY